MSWPVSEKYVLTNAIFSENMDSTKKDGIHLQQRRQCREYTGGKNRWTLQRKIASAVSRWPGTVFSRVKRPCLKPSCSPIFGTIVKNQTV